MENNLVESKTEVALKKGILAFLWFCYVVSWINSIWPMLLLITSKGLFLNEYQMDAKEYFDANIVALLLGQITGGLGIYFGPAAIERFSREG